MVHHFAYKDGTLFAEDVAIPEIANQFGTPFYLYSAATFRRHFQVLTEAFSKAVGTHKLTVAYAMKANSNQAMLHIAKNEGAGVDVVSGGELQRALRAGIDPEKIVFSGVGKNHAEIRLALQSNIHCFNIESEPELERINEIAGELGTTAPISVRVNPDVDAQTHAKISTGRAENKFGIPIERACEIYARIAALPHVQATGVDVHIGSQIQKIDPFRQTLNVLAECVKKLRSEGHNITHVDIGGGLGVHYDPNDPHPPQLDEYAQAIHELIEDLDCDLVVEPGRIIAANAGILVTKVEYIKSGAERTFTIVDAAMNDFIRPTLYEAHHEIWPIKESQNQNHSFGDIVGPVCESGDYFVKGRDLPQVEQGDLIAVMSAGAYGSVQAGTYNSRPLIAEILVDGDKVHAIRPAQTLENLIGRDSVPDWL